MTDPAALLIASRKLITQNAHLLEEARGLRKEMRAAFWRPWRWKQRAPLRAELNQLTARIEDNADRIDYLQEAAKEAVL